MGAFERNVGKGACAEMQRVWGDGGGRFLTGHGVVSGRKFHLPPLPLWAWAAKRTKVGVRGSNPGVSATIPLPRAFHLGRPLTGHGVAPCEKSARPAGRERLGR